MKHLQFCYKLFLFSVLIFFSAACLSQKVKIFKDSTSITAFVANKGDSIVVTHDSTIVLNKNTFHVFQRYYERGRGESAYFNEITGAYEDIIKKQDTMLTIKDEFYKELNAKFDSLSSNTQVFLGNTSNRVDSASSSLNSATTKLEDTQKLLKEAKELLDKERLKIGKRAFKFGLGGLVVGALVTAVILGN